MAKRQGSRTLCSRRRDSVHSAGSLAICGTGSSCPGTALCRSFCGADGGGFLYRGGLCLFVRTSVRAQFFNLLWRQRGLRSPDLHRAVCRICPLVLDGVRADFRSPARNHAHGEVWVGRCAIPDSVLEVGVAGILCDRGSLDTDSRPVQPDSHGGPHVSSVLDWSVQRQVFRQEKTCRR